MENNSRNFDSKNSYLESRFGLLKEKNSKICFNFFVRFCQKFVVTCTRIIRKALFGKKTYLEKIEKIYWMLIWRNFYGTKEVL